MNLKSRCVPQPLSAADGTNRFSASDRVVAVLKLAVVTAVSSRALWGTLQKALSLLHKAVGTVMHRRLSRLLRLLVNIDNNPRHHLLAPVANALSLPVFVICNLLFELACFFFELAIHSYKIETRFLRFKESILKAADGIKYRRSDLFVLNGLDDGKGSLKGDFCSGDRVHGSADSASPSSPVNAPESR